MMYVSNDFGLLLLSNWHIYRTDEVRLVLCDTNDSSILIIDT